MKDSFFWKYIVIQKKSKYIKNIPKILKTDEIK